MAVDKRPRVLIVDDDVDFTYLAQKALEKAGFDVTCAHSGEEGSQRAKEIKPDLIVLDTMMETQTEGFQVVHDLRQDPELRDISIMMLTSINAKAYPWRLDRDDTWLPVDLFLDKPVSGERLVAEVRRLLEAREVSRAS